MAADSADVLASLRSKKSAISDWSKPAAEPELRAIAVLMPPGCTQVTSTGCPAMSISWRSDSVNPRTANFAAL